MTVTTVIAGQVKPERKPGNNRQLHIIHLEGFNTGLFIKKLQVYFYNFEARQPFGTTDS